MRNDISNRVVSVVFPAPMQKAFVEIDASSILGDSIVLMQTATEKKTGK